MGTSCGEVHLRKAFYAVILSLGRINSLQLLAARTGGGTYPVEVCRQGKCDNARLQKAAGPASIGLGALHPALAYLN